MAKVKGKIISTEKVKKHKGMFTYVDKQGNVREFDPKKTRK